MFEVRLSTDQTWADLEDLSICQVERAYVAAGASNCWPSRRLCTRARGRMLEAYPVEKSERSHYEFMCFGSWSPYEKADLR